MSANLINYTERRTNNTTSANTKAQYKDRIDYAKEDASAIAQSTNIILSEYGATDRIRVSISVLHAIQGSRRSFEVCQAVIDNQLRKLEDTTPKDASEQQKGSASQRVRRRIHEILRLQKEIGIELIKYSPGSKFDKRSSRFELPIIDMAFQAYQLAKQDPLYKQHPGQTIERVSREFARKLLQEAKDKRQIKEKPSTNNPINQQLAALDKLERLLPNTDKNLSLAVEAALKANLDINQITHHIEVFRDSIFEISNMVIEQLHSHQTENEGYSTVTQGGDIPTSSEGLLVTNEPNIEPEVNEIPFTSEGYEPDLVIENEILNQPQNEQVVKCSICNCEVVLSQELERKLCCGCFSKSVSRDLDTVVSGQEIPNLGYVERDRIYQAIDMLMTFMSVGAVAFFLLLKDKDNFSEVACRKRVNPNFLLDNIDRLLAACDLWQVSLIIRPILSFGSTVKLVQLDDLSQDIALEEKLRLLSLITLETSLGNYQDWIAIKDISEEDRKLLRSDLVDRTSADSAATGAVRLAGSYNFKPEYKDNYPVVKLVDYETSLTVSVEQLREKGLLRTQDSPPCDSSFSFSANGEKRWCPHERCLAKAPFKKDGVTRDYSVADMNFAIINLANGFSRELVGAELEKVRSDKVMRNFMYVRLTLDRAIEHLKKKGHHLFT